MNGCKFAMKDIKLNKLKKVLIWIGLLILSFNLACSSLKPKFIRRRAIIFKYPNGVVIEDEWIETYDQKPSDWGKR